MDAPQAMPAKATAPKAITMADTPFCAAPVTPGSNSSGGRFSPSWSCSTRPPLWPDSAAAETASGGLEASVGVAPAALPSEDGGTASSGFFGVDAAVQRRAVNGRTSGLPTLESRAEVRPRVAKARRSIDEDSDVS